MHPENFPIFKIKRILMFIIPLCSMAWQFILPEMSIAKGEEDPGYYPPYVDYEFTIEVSGFVYYVEGLSENSYDQATPLSSVKLTVLVEYDEYDDDTGNPIHMVLPETVYSSSNGMYYKSFDLLKVFKGSVRIYVNFSNDNESNNMLLKSVHSYFMSDTYFIQNFFVIDLNDWDQ